MGRAMEAWMRASLGAGRGMDEGQPVAGRGTAGEGRKRGCRRGWGGKGGEG